MYNFNNNENLIMGASWKPLGGVLDAFWMLLESCGRVAKVARTLAGGESRSTARLGFRRLVRASSKPLGSLAAASGVGWYWGK